LLPAQARIQALCIAVAGGIQYQQSLASGACLVFNGTQISLPTYQVSWKLDVGAGTWTTN